MQEVREVLFQRHLLSCLKKTQRMMLWRSPYQEQEVSQKKIMHLALLLLLVLRGVILQLLRL